jgi:hypothetical protein
VPYGDPAYDRHNRDHCVSVSPKLPDETSYVSSPESSLDDGRHDGLIILLFVPNNHLSYDRRSGDCPKRVRRGCARNELN